jgi:aspartate aminotransferase
MTEVSHLLAPLYHFFVESAYAQRAGDPDICDFVAGNPQELPFAAFVTALGRWSVPQDKNWFAYKQNEAGPRAVIAASLRTRLGMPFEDEDIFLTNGAFSALAVGLATVVDPGDEVIFNSPPWFFYEALIASSGARPVRVHVDPATFDLDVGAIAAAITPRTRAIIVNSPNNPTGKLYPPRTLSQLASVLTEASERHGRTIYLLSDEAYCRILFDGHTHTSPSSSYPHTFVIYTYGKTLLTPGQRLGYLALPPTMPERDALRPAIFLAQLTLGHVFPTALLQHALADLEQLSIDVPHLQAKRDRLVAELRAMGYEVHLPEGTFYLLPRAPLADDLAFIELLAEHNVYCLPGTVVEMPGYFRISLTANDDMLERSLAGFATSREQAMGAASSPRSV